MLAAGTAFGKTEAAFLPVLTLLHEQPATTIGVLYIGPLKALINDQFERLSDLLQETVKLDTSKPKDLHHAIVSLGEQRITAQDLISPEEAPQL